MKKSILLLALILSSVMYEQANAQVSVNINIGNQPVWGPVGYDYVEYYYFPDGDFYYNVPRGEYVYFDGFRWIFSAILPIRWSNFDLYHSYKVVINEPNPFYRNDYYRSRYLPYRGRRQEIIYNSRDPRYYVIERHPEHQRWVESRRYDNDRRSVYNNPRVDNRNDRPNYGRNDNNSRNYGSGDNNRNYEPRRTEAIPNGQIEQRRPEAIPNRGMEQRRNEAVPNRGMEQSRSSDHSSERNSDRRSDGYRSSGGGRRS